ncbi:MAG: hypothetical protein GXY44_06055 [Phycisphaerales bacterium]|nr:hypothetical protein [Phycisphaerales bacterium]
MLPSFRGTIWLYMIAWIACWVGPVRTQGESASLASLQGAPIDRPPIAGRRIVAHFDFNDRPPGFDNPFPPSWRQHRAAGFPFYLEGRYDDQVGHEAPPSFRLQLDGGSLAYRYEERTIAVRTASDYVVSCWVRSEGLRNARAYITAYYMDRRGQRIEGTDRRSAMIGGSGELTDWQHIFVALPGNVPDSRYIGIVLWLAQSRIWQDGPAPLRSIVNEDVRATAWFDDITVYRLPRVALRTANPGQVFDEDERVELHTEISDPDGLNLVARLHVYSAEGHIILDRQVPIHTDQNGDFESISLDELPPGLYYADLRVSTEDNIPLVHRSLSFARVLSRISPPAAAGRRWGVILNEVEPSLLAGQGRLLQQLHPEFVKVPVWQARNAIARANGVDESIDRYLEAIVEANAEPIAVLRDDLPAGPYVVPGLNSILDLFEEDPLAWKPLIAGTWSRYAGLTHIWQIGQDGNEALAGDPRLGEIIPVLAREMQPLIGQPRLADVTLVNYQDDSPWVADYRAITVPQTVVPDDIRRYLPPLAKGNAERIWLTVESLDDHYPRELRLADLGRRLAEAYFLNLGGVFMQAPWHGRTRWFDAQVDPTEDFIVFRTVTDVLGGSMPVSRTHIGGRGRCLVFDRNGMAILFVWDEQAPPEGIEHFVCLGEDAVQVDLWGRHWPVPTIGSRQAVRIGPMPTFIVHTPTWLVEFRRQFALDPMLLEASFEQRRCLVVFRNTYHEPISGLVRLTPPDNWDIRPIRLPFALQPGEQFRQEIEVHFPLNAEAGIKTFAGDFTIDAERRYRFVEPAWFELGLKDLDLHTTIYRAGSLAVVRLTLTNRTERMVSFDGFVVAPGRQRMNRPFPNVLPGQSVTKEFAIEQADSLRGRTIRVGFNEVEGAYRLWNQLLTVP